jgi:hypothetical protein
MVVVDKRHSMQLSRREPTAAEQQSRAERLARQKIERAEDAPKAMQEYRANENAARLKLQKLREQRLARESSSAVLTVSRSKTEIPRG